MEVPLNKKSKSSLPWILTAIAVVGALAAIAITYKNIKTTDPQAAIEELTVPVKQENLAVEIVANGVVEPITRVKISPKTASRLDRLQVDRGMRVKPGQIIAVMKNDNIQAQGAEAEANLNSAIANAASSKIKLESEIKQAQARVFQAQAAFEGERQRIPKQIEQAKQQVKLQESQYLLALQRVKRYKSLLEEGAVTQDKFDEQLNTFRVAQANLEEAKKRVEELNETGSPQLNQLEASLAEAQLELQMKEKTARDEVVQLDATIKASEARVKSLVVDFRDTIIRAPFEGIVTQKYAEPGDIVSPSLGAGSTSIVEIARGLKIEAKVPEVDIGQIQKGQSVKIVADAYPDEVFQGQVVDIAPEAVIEQNVTSFKVDIGLKTGQDKLLSKMNTEVTFLGKEISNALVVPTVAIVTEKGATGVMIPDAQNKPKFKPVTIGVTIENQTQILSGLSSGERVFIDMPEEKKPEKL